MVSWKLKSFSVSISIDDSDSFTKVVILVQHVRNEKQVRLSPERKGDREVGRAKRRTIHC
jgi:hypothetical protein